MVAAAGQAIGLGLMKDDPAVKPEFGTMREYLEGAQAKDRGKRDTIANAPIPDMSGGSVKPTTAESPSALQQVQEVHYKAIEKLLQMLLLDQNQVVGDMKHLIKVEQLVALKY